MFRSMAELVRLAQSREVPLHEVVILAEMEQTELPRETLLERMQQRLDVMRRSAGEGLAGQVRSVSGMTGGDALRMWKWMEGGAQPLCGSLLGRAVARALSVGEVNAAMGCIVAAPTAGASGVLPGVLLTLQEAISAPDELLVDALFTAGGVGTVIVNRASISGAAGGCQAETGSAAAMAAAAAVELLGGTPHQSAQAVAIALKNMLGLVCDPVAGLVEVPCIKRNAGAVAQCFVAVDLAMAGVDSVIPPDEVIAARRDVGQRIPVSLRETAQGGLAHSPTGRCRAKEIWSKMGKTTGEEIT